MRRMHLVSFMIMLALLEYLIFALRVGSARVKYKVPAPATTGDPIFERHFCVHQNTMEQLVVFVPAMFIFATYVHMLAAEALGFLFVVTRAIYAMAYVKDPERRAGGAIATLLINTILVLGGLIGVVVRAFCVHSLVYPTASVRLKSQASRARFQLETKQEIHPWRKNAKAPLRCAAIR